MKRQGLSYLAVVVLVLGGAALPAFGAGFLVPKDEGLPPLAVKYLRVDTTIDNQAATTHVTQEFKNSTNRDLECTYIFPVPQGAAIRDFAMYIGGKRTTGELVEKDKARSVYEEIVRRARDPGLLEYMDSSILRMRVFPVPANGTQKIELEYTQLIPVDSGLAEYVFPLKVGEKASKTLDDFTVAVRIKSLSAIKSVYSPTHEVGVSRPSDHEAVAGMEMKAAVLDRDFHLFYTLSEKEFGLSLMTFRPDPDKPGMFLMLISPKSRINEAESAPRDAVFILDTSGSMEGKKIEQAKKALKFCLDKLDRKDRFAIVQFSTMAQAFADKWTDATEENVKKAREWVGAFDAAGGTNIGEALQKVFSLPYDESRSATVLFLTDGRPTVDVTDIEALMTLVKANNKKNLRIFTFGVGDDVNTHLLDRMANDTAGLPAYVREGEPIDGPVTRLFSKMTHPVLTELTLDVPGVKIAEMYPKQLPDLFHGGQIVVLGAYTGDGDSAIRLKGRVGKKSEELVFEGTFPKKATERTFIGPLYANRKIGFLLDQIRLHGENKELKDEVVRLSLAYGIETPYTSYLVLENEQQYKQYGIGRSGGSFTGGTRVDSGGDSWRTTTSFRTGPPSGAINGGSLNAPANMEPNMTSGGTAMMKDADRRQSASDRISATYGPPAGRAPAKAATAPAEAAPTMMPPRAPASGIDRMEVSGVGGGGAGLRAGTDDFKTADSGKLAVDIAQGIQKLRQSERVNERARMVQQVAGRPFVSYRGVWVDERFQGTEKLTKIKWGSEAFFRLVREQKDLQGAFALGERVVVVTARGQAVAVDPDDGVEKLGDDEVKSLFKDAAEAPKKDAGKK
jgi:Ca-activated chloride channel family protein